MVDLKTTILLVVVFCAPSIYCAKTAIQKYASRFSPITIMEGDHTHRQYPKYKMEVTLSFGLDEDELKFIEAVIEQHFDGNRKNVDVMNVIQETIESYMGRFWGIQYYDDPYMFYSTSVKRAKQFVVYDVNGMGIGIFKEA